MDTKVIIKEAELADLAIKVRGVQGPRGAIGNQGEQGEQGAQGVQGAQGYQGEAGTEGQDGEDAALINRYSVIETDTVFTEESEYSFARCLNRILLVKATKEITLEFPYPYRNNKYLEPFFIIANDSNFDVRCIAYNDSEGLGGAPAAIQLDFIVKPKQYRMILFNFTEKEPNNYVYQKSLNRWRVLF